MTRDEALEFLYGDIDDATRIAGDRESAAAKLFGEAWELDGEGRRTTNVALLRQVAREYPDTITGSEAARMLQEIEEWKNVKEISGPLH